MKDEVKKERDQSNGRDLKSKSKDRRTRSPRRDRSRSPVDRRNKDSGSGRMSKTVYVANISFDTHWSEVKDFFRDKIGNVVYCRMFENEEGRSRGCGLIEFSDVASAKKAIDELHRYDFKGRELVVKEDIDAERDRYGRLINDKKNNRDQRDRGSHQRDSDRDNRQIYDPMAQAYSNPYNNTFGLSPDFLQSLNIKGPLNNRIFVANLDYNVGEKKLEEIFRLAGKALRVRLYKDHKDVSKGYATVEFEHAVEAVQAISMFHDQNLYGRPMSIRMDKYETEEMPEVLPSKLPAGLESIGKGLGVNGQPLNVGKSLWNAANQQQNNVQSLASQTNSPLPVAQPAQLAPQQQVSSYNTSYNLSGLSSSLAANQLAQTQNVMALNSNLSNPQMNQALANTCLPAGLGSLGLGNLSAPTLNSLNSQNLTQLANTAQDVLSRTAALGNSSMNPSLSSLASSNNLYQNFQERDYQVDKYRNGLGQSTMSNPMSNTISTGATEKVIVRNLPQSFNFQELKRKFQTLGDIYHFDNKGRGTVLFCYRNPQDATNAVRLLHGSSFDGKQLDVGLYY